MKLYTEEELFKAMDFARGYHKMTDSQFIDSLTPIELPSDEEIDNELFYQKQVMNPYPTEEYAYTAYEKGFMEAAKWMIDKIKGGNK